MYCDVIKISLVKGILSVLEILLCNAVKGRQPDKRVWHFMVLLTKNRFMCETLRFFVIAIFGLQ